MPCSGRGSRHGADASPRKEGGHGCRFCDDRAWACPRERGNVVRRGVLLRRRTSLRRGAWLVQRTPLRRRRLSPASEAQRQKVAGKACLACGRRPSDPAHLVPRSLGGCDDPDCVVPLCRPCHRAFDQGGLDLLPDLEPRHRMELAHALGHISLVALLERVTGERWRAACDRSGAMRGDEARRI